MAAIEHRGLNTVTNFDISHYVNHWHRHCHGPYDSSLGTMDIAPSVSLQLDLPKCSTSVNLDIEETTGNAEFHNGKDYLGHLSGTQQLPDKTGPPAHQMAPTSSALDLVLQSPRFKELMQQISTAGAFETSGDNMHSSPSTSMCSFSPSPLELPSSSLQQPAEFIDGAPPRCSFPDDVQSFFDFKNDNDMSFVYAEVDTFLFDDLGAYAAPMFDFDLFE